MAKKIEKKAAKNVVKKVASKPARRMKKKVLDRLRRTDTLALLRRVCALSDQVDGSLESAEAALIDIRRLASDCLQDMGAPILDPVEQL